MHAHAWRTGLLTSLLAIGLSGCDNVIFNNIIVDSPFTPLRTMQIASNPEVVSTNKIYHAPAQTYDLDLGSTAFTGKLDLRASCTPEGNSLSVTDQAGQISRIDAINLKGNTKLPNADTLSIQELSQQIVPLYAKLYNTYTLGELRMVRSPIGPAGYIMVASQQQLTPIGLLIAKQGDYAYVLQYKSNGLKDQQMQQALIRLATSMQIPGKQLKKSSTPMALSIDLAQSTPAQLDDWKKTANCS